MVKSIKKRIIFVVSIALSLLLCSNVNAKEIVVSPEKGNTSGVALSINNNSFPIAVNTTFNFGGLYFYGAKAGGSFKTLGAFYNIPSTGCYNVSITASFSGSTSFAPNSYTAFLRLTDNESSIPFSNDGISSQYLPSGGSFNNGGIYSSHKDNLCLSKGRYGFLWYMNGMTFYENQYYGFGNMILTPVPTDDFVTEQKNTTNAINKTNDTINKTNNTIKDDNVDSSKANDTIESAKSKLAQNGSISQLLTLPITLYQSILNSLNGSCSPISLGTLFDNNLDFPCINLQELLGSTLYNIIDILCCGLFILSFRKKMVDIFNHMSSLNDRGNELE